MTTDVKSKPTALDKLNTILDRLELGEAIEAWQASGDRIHQRIDEGRKELNNHENKLQKKDAAK